MSGAGSRCQYLYFCTRIACFTSTNVQILTPALAGSRADADEEREREAAVEEEGGKKALSIAPPAEPADIAKKTKKTEISGDTDEKGKEKGKRGGFTELLALDSLTVFPHVAIERDEAARYVHVCMCVCVCV
jgi:hypothetical protein